MPKPPLRYGFVTGDGGVMRLVEDAENNED
jgi:hypothetical protein